MTAASAFGRPAAMARQDSRPTAALTRPAEAFDMLAVIDSRGLERACFVQCLQAQSDASRVVGYASVSEWQADSHGDGARQVILLNLGARALSDASVRDEVRKLVGEARPVPVIVLGASEEFDTLLAALECGAIGYISPSVQFPDIMEAARIALSGAVFVSRASLMSLRSSMPVAAETGPSAGSQFTERQLAVAQALRRGAANKTIAYELDLQESTVKVHIRHIFRKLNATNRTQAAFLLNNMTGWPDEPSRA